MKIDPIRIKYLHPIAYITYPPSHYSVPKADRMGTVYTYCHTLTFRFIGAINNPVWMTQAITCVPGMPGGLKMFEAYKQADAW